MWPSVPLLRQWKSRKTPTRTDGAPGAGHVGYLVNTRAGLTGDPGIGYDYVLAANGLYVQAESESIQARILTAQAGVRGLADSGEQLRLRHGPIPAGILDLGLEWFRATTDTERIFTVLWDQGRYRTVVPAQAGSAGSLRYTPPKGVILEVHSHCRMNAFFSDTDDSDEQGFHIYGVVGRIDRERPQLSLRVGVYGHFAPVRWEQVFTGPRPDFDFTATGAQ